MIVRISALNGLSDEHLSRTGEQGGLLFLGENFRYWILSLIDY